jgi:tRNA G18 (ribose-2'-O)-methylase SpoU
MTFANIQHKLEEIENGLNKVDVGIVILDEKTLIPIQSGKLQIQHTVSIDGKLNTIDVFTNDKVKAFLCAFSPRAETVCISPNEEERPIDLERLKSLDKALLELTSTTAEELLSEVMAGTSPARIYRSFVCPRPKAVHILEPIERAANRTAAQIELALRQVRADNAAYLRNTDKALQSVFQIKSKSENDEQTNNDDQNENSFKRKTINPVVLVLDNVRSAFNVGSLFRTGETAGIAELITVGITIKPPHPKLRKTALGSMDVVPSRHFLDIIDCIETLKKEGYTIVTMETTDKSQLYTEVNYPKKIALILGNEVMGVDTRVMDISDMIVEIPTFGVKNSLNVASAGPIVLFEVLRQWNKQ